MDKEYFNKLVASFFEALRKKTLLIIIDTASKYEKAVFSLVSFSDGEYVKYSGMLKELGFKQYRKQNDLYVTYCAGAFRCYIPANIFDRLKARGIDIPSDIYNIFQYQHCI